MATRVLAGALFLVVALGASFLYFSASKAPAPPSARTKPVAPARTPTTVAARGEREPPIEARRTPVAPAEKVQPIVARPPEDAVPRKPALDLSWFIVGTVRDVAGQPLAGAVVAGLPWIDLTVETDVKGAFRLGPFPEDLRFERPVTVSSSGFYTDVKRGQPGGPPIAFTLGDAGVLRGRVTYQETGAPCPAKVALDIGVPVAVETDAQGVYRMPDLKPGEYRARIDPERGTPLRDVSVRVVARESVEVNFEIGGGFIVRGTVVDENTRAPIGGARVITTGQRRHESGSGRGRGSRGASSTAPASRSPAPGSACTRGGVCSVPGRMRRRAPTASSC